MGAEGAAEKAVAKEGEHVIAKAVESAGVRESEQVTEHVAERGATEQAARQTTERTVVDPHAHVGPDPIDHTRPGGDLIPDDYQRFGDLNEQEFLDKHWDPDKINDWDGSQGGWRYPDNQGYAGESRVIDDLPEGYRIDRFGGTGGDFVSPEGTPFGQRALPPDSLGKDYHVYRLAKPFDGESGLPTGGRVARAFEQDGGGVQFKLPQSVQWLIDHGYLREVQ